MAAVVVVVVVVVVVMVVAVVLVRSVACNAVLRFSQDSLSRLG